MRRFRRLKRFYELYYSTQSDVGFDIIRILKSWCRARVMTIYQEVLVRSKRYIDWKDLKMYTFNIFNTISAYYEMTNENRMR